MSGPLERPDEVCAALGEAPSEDERLAGIELREGRRAEVGGLPIQRVLPTKGRRTVGAWCFVDLAGPADAEEPDPMEVGPHPHTGLSTVTWLLEGEALHSDSLGTQQVIRPGELNLMTAGHGIAHAELAAQPPFRGVQLWIAQPEETRHTAAAFEHHAELPGAEVTGGEGTVLAGSFAGQTAPTRCDTPLVGVDLTLTSGRRALELDRTFDHAVIPLDGRLRVGMDVVEEGWLALVPAGIDELPIDVRDDCRVLVLGGEPLGERIQMWWNFVGRDRDELTAAYREWRDRTDRFGDVPSDLDRIDAPVPPWLAEGGRA